MGGYRADAGLGVDGLLSRRLLRLTCRAAGQGAFAKAAADLREYLGVEVSDETVRVYVERQGVDLAAWQANAEALAADFQAKTGHFELEIDAGKVNTQTGWRDYKIAVIGKRDLAAAATPKQWSMRPLPEPNARTMFAALSGIDDFQSDWRARTAWLGLDDPSQLHVLGDGADWIWNAAQVEFPGCRQTLDIYHAAEHIADAAKVIHGDGAQASTIAFERGRDLLLTDGWAGLCRLVAEQLPMADTPAKRTALDSLTAYFAKHTVRLNYRENLEQGRPIGSGIVEGAAKTAGLRLKARGARWNPTNVTKMAGVVCLLNSTYWPTYWAQAY